MLKTQICVTRPQCVNKQHNQYIPCVTSLTISIVAATGSTKIIRCPQTNQTHYFFRLYSQLPHWKAFKLAKISAGERPVAARLLRSWVRIPSGAWIFVCCECRVLAGRGICDELITRPEESYRLCCVVVYDLETSRIGTPYIYI